MLVVALCALINLIEKHSGSLGSESQVSKVMGGCTETQWLRGREREEQKEADSCRRRGKMHQYNV